MRRSNTKHGGTYLRSHHKHNTLLKVILLGIVVVMVSVIVFTQVVNAESGTVYHLPDEVPSLSIPDDLADNSGSHSIDDLVTPYYCFKLAAGDQTIDVSLPIIEARYGADFNAAITERLGTLVNNILFYLERDESYIVKRISYETYLDQEMLTVLLWTDYVDGQSRCEPWFFDLTEGKQITETWKQAETLLGMEYSTFLWVTDRYIQNTFAEIYYEQVHNVPVDQLNDEQRALLDDYSGILREIPCDIDSAFSRWIFPAEGKVYMVYELPLICDDWYSGFRTEAKIVEIDSSILMYTDLVTPTEATKEAIFNSTVHVMGGTDQAHALLVRRIFYSSPKAFIDAVADSYEWDQKYAIESLLRYGEEGELQTIQELCCNLKRCTPLTNGESEVITWIISEIDQQSQ